MQITINNHSELLDFIKREDINSKQATEIVCKALKVSVVFEISKEELINQTEYYINKFCQGDILKRPIFLGQKEVEFSINDFYNPDK